jgi:ankyrin repeat protein
MLPSTWSQSGWTALHNAAMNCNLAAVQALLVAGADRDALDSVSL